MARIRIDGEELEFSGKLLDFLLSIRKNPDSYLYICNGKPIPVDSEPSDDVEAIRVASGG
jgi:hypothetical protein